MKILASVTLIVAAVQLPGAAVARIVPDEPPQRVVRYADLDLTRPAGAATLYSRLRAAARDVCDPVNPRDRTSGNCAEAAMARAVADVNAPVLTDYYLSKTGQDVKTFESLRRERQTARVDVGAR